MGVGHSFKSQEPTREAGDQTPLPATPVYQLRGLSTTP